MTDATDPRLAVPNFSIPAGTGVAIVAPGGYAPEEAATGRGIALLEAQGCLVKNYYEHDARYLRFGGTDEDRAEQLHRAARDPDVQIVIALRGSYGLSRLMHLIDWQLLADSGKLFVGYSDLTALHLGLLAKTGAISFAGPMLVGDFGGGNPSAWTLRNFWQVMTQPRHTVTVKTPNPEVDVEGTLWGGNLAVLTHLLGMPYFPRVQGGILFVEDINEHPYRIERMMLQLLHNGVLEKQKAVIFGDFSNYRLTDYDNGYDFKAMLAYVRQMSPVPVLTGLPFGHINDRVTLPVGGRAHLVSGETGFTLELSRYPFVGVGAKIVPVE